MSPLPWGDVINAKKITLAALKSRCHRCRKSTFSPSHTDSLSPCPLSLSVLSAEWLSLPRRGFFTLISSLFFAACRVNLTPYRREAVTLSESLWDFFLPISPSFLTSGTRSERLFREGTIGESIPCVPFLRMSPSFGGRVTMASELCAPFAPHTL